MGKLLISSPDLRQDFTWRFYSFRRPSCILQLIITAVFRSTEILVPGGKSKPAMQFLQGTARAFLNFPQEGLNGALADRGFFTLQVIEGTHFLPLCWLRSYDRMGSVQENPPDKFPCWKMGIPCFYPLELALQLPRLNSVSYDKFLQVLFM
jgi:hypothetical protein